MLALEGLKIQPIKSYSTADSIGYIHDVATKRDNQQK
jgi:hypothetical protein